MITIYPKTIIEFTKESGQIILTEEFQYETIAQQHFDKLEEIKYPNTYKQITLNLSEYPEGRVGSVRLVYINKSGERFVRRELFRKP